VNEPKSLLVVAEIVRGNLNESIASCQELVNGILASIAQIESACRVALVEAGLNEIADTRIRNVLCPESSVSSGIQFEIVTWGFYDAVSDITLRIDAVLAPLLNTIGVMNISSKEQTSSIALGSGFIENTQRTCRLIS